MTNLTTCLAHSEAALRAWWDGAPQKYPCLLLSAAKPGGSPIPDTDDLERHWNDVELIVERKMGNLEQTEYYGVSVPFHAVSYGSSAMSGVLGARMELLNRQTVWAHPVFDSIEQLLEVDLHPETPCCRTLQEVTRRSVALSPGHHFVAHFPLEGVTDLAASLYGTDNLLADLILKPAQVKRAFAHLKRLWIETFDRIAALIAQGGNPGGIGWAGIWAPGTTFPLQEDFSFMISREMYDEFCLPQVADMADAMDYPMYHLDGVPAARHLDSLLGLKKLRAIQWVPGPGNEPIHLWYELLRRIIAAGKSVEVFARPDEIEDLVDQVGARGLLISVQDASREDIERLLDKYGD